MANAQTIAAASAAMTTFLRCISTPFRSAKNRFPSMVELSAETALTPIVRMLKAR
jgi:hypothetical protein